MMCVSCAVCLDMRGSQLLWYQLPSGYVTLCCKYVTVLQPGHSHTRNAKQKHGAAQGIGGLFCDPPPPDTRGLLYIC